MNLSTQGGHRPALPWTIYVIHHSHTDIGYTERQERIEQYHVDFIRQALDITEAAQRGSARNGNRSAGLARPSGP